MLIHDIYMNLDKQHCNHAYNDFLSYRRAALHLWKQRLGSKATYKELKNVFMLAGYRNYANTVQRVVTDSKSIIPTREIRLL
jgi:hypothetical protein